MKEDIKSLPIPTLNLIQKYLNLNVGGKKIRCPYFQNFLHKRGKPAYVGKGTPSEIEAAAKELFLRIHKNISNLESDQIRLCMIMLGVGVDCSGFVLRILESYFCTLNLGSLKTHIHPNANGFVSLLRHKLKFSTNVSADALTSPKNTVLIDICDVMPADLIRFGKGHVALVSEVVRNDGVVKKIGYYHSTYDYFEESGVKKGEIIVKNQDLPLEKQEWSEILRGNNWTLMDFMRCKPDDRGLRRLKALV